MCVFSFILPSTDLLLGTGIPYAVRFANSPQSTISVSNFNYLFYSLYLSH